MFLLSQVEGQRSEGADWGPLGSMLSLGALGRSKETPYGPTKFRPKTFSQGSQQAESERKHPSKICRFFFSLATEKSESGCDR